MSRQKALKGNSLCNKLFILIAVIFAFLLLHADQIRAIRNVSRKTTARRKSAIVGRSHVPSESSFSVRYPLNTSVHKDTVQTAWCVVDHKNMGKSFYHFPHTLQVLSRCWSYFMMERRKYGVTSCGFFFDMIENKRPFNYIRISPWARDLIKTMNCSQIIRGPRSAHKMPPSTDDFYYLKRTRHWFEEREDIAPLQELVLRKRKDGYARLDEFVNRTIAVGLIQRVPRIKRCDKVPVPNNCGHFREFVNLKKIQKALAKNFPLVKIKNTKLKHMNLVEQASWWWHKDIVIAAHGAALSNVLFMRQRTAVIEIFPTGYEKMMFQQLMADAGVYGHRMLNATQKGKKGFKNRNVPLEPNVDEIVRLVHEALQRLQNDAISATR